MTTKTTKQQYRAIMDAFIRRHKAADKRPGAWIGPYCGSAARRKAEALLATVQGGLRWGDGEQQTGKGTT